MADHIGVDIDGIRGAVLRFDVFPDLARSKLRDKIREITDQAESMIRANAPARTGKLKGEIASDVREGDWGITGNVFMTGEWAKAGALNYGAHRPTKVIVHMMGLDHFWALKLTDPIRVKVRLHHRNPNITKTPFISGPADEMHKSAITEMQQAVNEAIAESGGE